MPIQQILSELLSSALNLNTLPPMIHFFLSVFHSSLSQKNNDYESSQSVQKVICFPWFTCTATELSVNHPRGFPAGAGCFWIWKCSCSAGCYSQTGAPSSAAQRHQRRPEEPAAPHACKPSAGPAEGPALLAAVLQSPHVLWLPKPYDAWLKQVLSHGFLGYMYLSLLIRHMGSCEKTVKGGALNTL